jgi:ATP-dependent RNA helicase DDX52/ROK1
VQLPSKGGVCAVFLCSARELAMQTTRELKKLVVGTKFRVRVMTKTLAACNDFSNVPCDILVSTPLRLDFLLKESKINLSEYGILPSIKVTRTLSFSVKVAVSLKLSK